ncbi:MAG: hypothetical protein ACREOK_13565 [Gemmatimonadaceae bacterium]
MHRPVPEHEKRASPFLNVLRVVLLISTATLLSCVGSRPDPWGGISEPRPTYRYASDRACDALLEDVVRNKSDTALKLASDCAHRYDVSVKKTIMRLVRAEMRRLGEVAMDIPEFHDEQRLAADVPNELGPLAGIFASPYLSSFTQSWQMRHQGKPGVLAGYIVVMQQDDEPLPTSYSKLNLGWGLNCVYLQSKPGGGFDAWIIQPGLDKPCRDADGNVAITAGLSPLQVNVISTGFPQSDMIPAARFLEDNIGRTVFGLPCLADWCEIGAPGFVSRTTTYCDWFTGDATVACPATREAKIPSWFDEQRMEQKVGTKWIATNIRAAIVPQPGIADLDAGSFATPQHVSNVYVSVQPTSTSKLYIRGFRRGENRIRLHRHPTAGWQYTVTAMTHPLTAAQISALKSIRVLGPHKHYDAPVPGTTRWRFTIKDPGMWGPCGGLCCDGEGF